MSIRTPTQTGRFDDAHISAGVDWITIIADSRSEGDSLVEVVAELGLMEAAAGAPVKPFRFMGYTGRMVGGARWGWNGSKAVAQLSGELCNDSWSRLRSSCGRVTRLDLQTTVSLSSSQTKFARRLLRPSIRGTARRRQYPIRTGYSSDTSGLCIGTVGQRTDRSYARVYDKGVESRTAPAGTKWRVELEAKLDLGAALWEQLKSQEDVPGWCYGICAQQWKSWGLSWPLPRSRAKLVLPSAPRKEAAPAHALAAWLRSSVAPTIPRVLTTYSVPELLAILGIEHLAMERQSDAD